MPESKLHRYESANATVTWDAKRCIHAAECIRALPGVFNAKAKPWITPSAADADSLLAAIERCPSGALHFEGADEGIAEAVPEMNTATLNVDGPTYLRGDLVLLAGDSSVVLGDTRMALCRCGASKNKPFCDNSHREIAFRHPATLPQADAGPPNADRHGTLTLKPITNGPLQCAGALTVVGSDGRTAFAEQTFLCRCGGSRNKPYCDGTHKKNGFTG